ncbi:MAG TPA: O-antigen ligase family protein [Acidimicrobiales bacterium]|nr:O-antigen ligase family protein [Acidimicrobiales bacterium]
MALSVVRPAAPPDPPGAAGRPGQGTTWGTVAAGIALVVPLASVPVVALPTWAVRWALLPALAGLGLPLLIASKERAARWALAWLTWAGLATALAPQPIVAFWGEYSVGTGLLFLAAVAGAFAIGARAGREAARPIATALLIGCSVNATIAIAAQLSDLTAFGVAPLQGRAVGLYGNPVYLAELLAGGLWIALHRLDRRWGAAAAVVIAAAVELSGSRAALIFIVGAAAVALWKVPVRRVVVIAVVAGGIALGAAVAAAAPGSSTGTDRVSTVAVADTGIAPRASTWEAGIASLDSRPLWGWGPDGTLAATGPRRNLTVARDEGPDVMFADSHNVFVESAVTTGLVGLALLLTWLACAVVAAHRPRAARGEGLLGFAALAAAVSLVEPAHVGVTPLAALALGSAGAWTARPRHWRALAIPLGAAGVAATVWLLGGLVALHQADLGANPSRAETAARRLPAWGEPDAVVGRLIAYESITRRDQRLLDQAITWWGAAAARDPADPSRWNDLAGAVEHAGDLPSAAAAYRHALEDDPWSQRALNGVVRIGARGRFSPSEVAEAHAKLARLSARSFIG